MSEIPKTCPTALVQGGKCLSVKKCANGTEYYRGIVDRSCTINNPHVTKPSRLLQCVPGKDSVLGKKGVASVNTFSDDTGKYIEVWCGNGRAKAQAFIKKVADRVGNKFVDILGARQEVGKFIKSLK